MLYRRLRKKLFNDELDQEYLSKLLEVSRPSVSYRLTGKVPWRLDEMYKVMNALKIPHDQMHIYFPEGGRMDMPENTEQCHNCPFSA